MFPELVEFQMALSTAEQEAGLFTEIESEEQEKEEEKGWLSSGTYRVVDGQLYRLVPGIPPDE